MPQAVPLEQTVPTETQATPTYEELVKLLTEAWADLEAVFWFDVDDEENDVQQGIQKFDVLEPRTEVDDKPCLTKQETSERKEGLKEKLGSVGNAEVEAAPFCEYISFIRLINDESFQEYLVRPTEGAQKDLNEQVHRIQDYIAEVGNLCRELGKEAVAKCSRTNPIQKKDDCNQCKQKDKKKIELEELNDEIYSELTMIFVRMGERLNAIPGGSNDYNFNRRNILSEVTKIKRKWQINWPVKEEPNRRKSWREQERNLFLQWYAFWNGGFFPSSFEPYTPFGWSHLKDNDKLLRQFRRLDPLRFKEHRRSWSDFFIATAIEMFETHKKTDQERSEWRENLLKDVLGPCSREIREYHWPRQRLYHTRKRFLSRILKLW